MADEKNFKWMVVLNDGETYAPLEECTVVLVDVGDGFRGDEVAEDVEEQVAMGAGYALSIEHDTDQVTRFGTVLLPTDEELQKELAHDGS